MIPGDLVRFKRTSDDADWNIGLLLEYIPYMKIAEILYEGKRLSIHARLVQLCKAGSKGKREKR
jgi:hypothetical protein|tara:strand:+ start:1027 stop:1218 length:192 start_codon:yes stop_codon:yes gene_type:complete